ncbi:MAG: methylenetetrahydrofolate reductase [Planctomycetota bacterium]
MSCPRPYRAFQALAPDTLEDPRLLPDRPAGVQLRILPPKTTEGEGTLMKTVADLKSSVEPDFVSSLRGPGLDPQPAHPPGGGAIAAGAGGDRDGPQTCVADTPEGIRSNLSRLAAGGVQNVLALRGDQPQDAADLPHGGLGNATDLIDLLREEFDFSVGAACYPENHPNRPDASSDLRWTVEKVRRGAEPHHPALLLRPGAVLRLLPALAGRRGRCARGAGHHADHERGPSGAIHQRLVRR